MAMRQLIYMVSSIIINIIRCSIEINDIFTIKGRVQNANKTYNNLNGNWSNQDRRIRPLFYSCSNK